MMSQCCSVDADRRDEMMCCSSVDVDVSETVHDADAGRRGRTEGRREMKR